MVVEKWAEILTDSVIFQHPSWPLKKLPRYFDHVFETIRDLTIGGSLCPAAHRHGFQTYKYSPFHSFFASCLSIKIDGFEEWRNFGNHSLILKQVGYLPSFRMSE